MLRAFPPMNVSSTSTSPRQLLEGAGLHREPDAVEHEPRRLLRDAERPAQLVAS